MEQNGKTPITETNKGNDSSDSNSSNDYVDTNQRAEAPSGAREPITALPAVVANAPAHPPRGFVLWLSVAQLISWGTLFYTFSLLLAHFEKDLTLTQIGRAHV